MHRFFAKEITGTQKVILEENDQKHLVNSLRIREGEQIEIVYENTTYLCEVKGSSKEGLNIEVVNKLDENRESDIYIHLYQGIPKASKLEEVIQHGTECGISEFTPVEMHRSVAKITDENKAIKKVERYSFLAKEAAKQSKRMVIPKVNSFTSFSIAVSNVNEDLIIVFFEDENETKISDIKSVIRQAKSVAIFIGPEGGLSEDEISILKSKGAYIATLGKRILRTETAGLVAASLIIYEHEQE